MYVFVVYTLQHIHTMVDIAKFVSITGILVRLFNFSSDTTGYLFYYRDSLNLYDQEDRRVYISSGDARFVLQIYSMEKEGDDSFKFTYGKQSSHILVANSSLETVILKMPETENTTQRNILEEYFNKLVDFFNHSNQHITRANTIAPMRF